MVLRWDVLRQRGGDPSAPIASDPLAPSPSPPPILARTRWNSGKGRRHMFTASAWPMFGLSRYADMITMLMAFLYGGRQCESPLGASAACVWFILIILMAHPVLQ